MSGMLGFGEQVHGYPVRVLNERTVRAAAGIVFFFAIVSFMNAWLIGNFQPTRVFVVAFLIDFTIRIFIKARYAPSLILGQWFVRKQQPDYVGAPQKRFAWAIGFALALTMLYLVVVNNLSLRRALQEPRAQAPTGARPALVLQPATRLCLIGKADS